MGCDSLTGPLIALCEVTVNKQYDMSTSDHPISDGWIFRFRRDQSPAHELHLSAAFFMDNDGNILAGRDVVTGLELGQVFVTVFVQSCI
jgi:hypothetical protein